MTTEKKRSNVKKNIQSQRMCYHINIEINIIVVKQSCNDVQKRKNRVYKIKIDQFIIGEKVQKNEMRTN